MYKIVVSGLFMNTIGMLDCYVVCDCCCGQLCYSGTIESCLCIALKICTTAMVSMLRSSNYDCLDL